MAKFLKCGDLVSGCTAVFHGATEAEVVRQEIDHSKAVHHLGDIPKSLERKIHRLIQDDRKR